MRPRLPLCLLPFAGAAALLFSISTSEAANYTIQNYLSTGSQTGGRDLYAYGFNLTDNRGDYIDERNTLLELNNTFTFVVNPYDAFIHGHPGGGTYAAFVSPITLSAKGGGNVTAGNYGNIIRVGNGTLTIDSRWNAGYPVDGVQHSDPSGGAEYHRVRTNSWMYVMQMGLQSVSNSTASEVLIDFSSNTSVPNQYLIISSQGPIQELSIFGISGARGDTTVQVLQSPQVGYPNSKPYPLNYDKDASPANVNMANFSVKGSNTTVIYADSAGSFEVTRNLQVSELGTMVFKNATYVNISGTTTIDNAHLVVEGALTPNAGGYEGSLIGSGISEGVRFSDVNVKESGGFHLHLDNVLFYGALNIIDGGAIFMNGSNFTVRGDVNIDGYSSLGYDRSTVHVSSSSVGGIFGGNISVRNFGTLRLEGVDTVVSGNIDVQQNGIFVLGSQTASRESYNITFAPGQVYELAMNGWSGKTYIEGILLPETVTPIIGISNSILINGSLTFGKNARIEVSVANETQINGSLDRFEFSEDVYFALFKPIEEVRYMTYDVVTIDGATTVQWYTNFRGERVADIPYTGDIHLSNNARLTLTYSVSIQDQVLDTSNDGDYEMAGLISGQGSVNLLMKNSRQRYTLSGANTYSGDTSITLGVLEITNENWNGSYVETSSLGSGNGKIIFVNDPEWNAFPGFGLSSDYNGVDTTQETVELHRNLQIGVNPGTASALFIAGYYDVVADDGIGLQTEFFAPDVILYGNIDEYYSSTGHWAKDGNGRLTLAGYSLTSGGIFINDGTLALIADDSLKGGSIVVFNEYGYDLGGTPQIPTLEFGSDMTYFANTIQLSDRGRLDATKTNGTFSLNSVIYTPEDSVALGRTLELYAREDQGIVLLGDIDVRNSTIKFYGESLVIASQVYGDETIFDLGGKAQTSTGYAGEYFNEDFNNAYASANIVFDTRHSNAIDANGDRSLYFLSDIVGAAAFIKMGEGILLLGSDLGEGSYSGNTIIEEGALIMVEGGKISYSSTLDIQRNLEEGRRGTFNLNGTEQYANKLVGGGTLATDGGILTISGAHTVSENFWGNLTGNGTLAINNLFNLSGLDPDDPDRLANDLFYGTYRINEGGVLTTQVNYVLSPNAEVNLAGEGSQMVLTGTLQNINELNSDQPTAVIDFGANYGNTTGLIIGTLYEDEQEHVATGLGVYYGQIIGDGSLTKQGSGTLKLVGSTLTYTGDTIVSEGMLYVDAVNFVNSDFNVMDYGTLFVDVSNGDVSIGNMLLSGTLETKGLEHTFYVDHLTLDGATMKLQAYIDENGIPKCAAININGIVDFAPFSEINTFELDLLPGNWPYGTSGAGSVVDMFRANLTAMDDIDKYFRVTNDYIFLNLEMYKDGVGASDTQISVDITRKTRVTFESVTGNAFAPALDEIDRDYRANNTIGGQSKTMLSQIMDQFYVMRNVDDVALGVETLSGASAYIVPTAEMEDFRRHTNLVRNRASSIGLRAPNAVLRDEEYNVWGSGIAHQSSLSSDGPVPGYDKDTWGGMLGFDTAVSSELAWGMSFSYTHSKVKVNNGEKVEIDTYYIDGFARYQKDDWSYLGIATLGWGNADTERNIRVGEIGGTARGSTDSIMISAYGEVGYDFRLQNNWIIQPFGSLTIGNYNNDGYNESGMGDAGLNVESLNQFICRLGGGARGIHFFQADAWEQFGRVEVRAVVTQDLTDVSPKVGRSFINSASSKIDAQGSGMGKTAFEIGAGIQVPVAYNVYVFADVSGEFRTKQSSVYGDLGVRVTF